MSDGPIIYCTLRDIQIPVLREFWKGYQVVSPWIRENKLEIPAVPDDARSRLSVVDFRGRVENGAIEAFARGIGMVVSGPEWLWVANACMGFGTRPLVAPARLKDQIGGPMLYTQRTGRTRIELHVAWPYPAWSIECLFLLVAPM